MANKIVKYINTLLSDDEQNRMSYDEYVSWAQGVLAGEGMSEAFDTTSLSPVYRALTAISEGIAQLPIDIYENEGDGKNYYKNNLYYLLNVRPHPLYSAFTLWKTAIIHMYVFGNAYIKINRDAGVIVSLEIVDPNSVTIKSNRGGTSYTIKNVGTFSSDDIIHIINYSIDGIGGKSTAKYAYKSISSLLAIEKYASSYAANNGALNAIIETEKPMKQEQIADYLSSWRSIQNPTNGPQNTMMVLGGGAKYREVGNAPSEFITSYKLDVIVDVARFFNISPIKLFDLRFSNYNSAEQANMNFYSETLLPIIRKIEQELSYKLFLLPYGKKMWQTNTVEFNVDKFLEADLKSKTEHYTKLLNAGVMTINEVRTELGYMKVDEAIADKILLQTNNIGTGDSLVGNETKNDDK